MAPNAEYGPETPPPVYLCGKDFETGEALKDHVERRHPKRDVRWWVVVEDPAKDLKFSR